MKPLCNPAKREPWLTEWLKALARARPIAEWPSSYNAK